MKISSNNRTHITLAPFYLFYVIIILLVMKNSFFWDKDVIISRQAFWFLENNFSINLPDTLDTGFFPALSILLALLWKIFGKTLMVGHLLMLPFAIGLIYQYYRILNYLSNNRRFILYTLILLIIDTTLLSQIVVVSTDLILVFFFFLSINSIFYKKRKILYLSLLGLSLSHFRGAMSCIIVLAFDYLMQLKSNNYKEYVSSLIKIIPSYLPFFIFHLIYLGYHYKNTGWILKHDESPWAGCYETVDFKGFLFNFGILIWRSIDYGRLFYWLLLGYFIVKFLRFEIKADATVKLILYLIIISAVIYFPSMLIYKVLSAHRYLLVFFNLITIIIGYLLFVAMKSVRFTRIAYSVSLVGMITGNLWIYPDKIAKGWDSTIAHLPFYNLRNKMIDFIEQKKIPFNDIGSDIPNTYPLKYVFLNGDEKYFPLKDFDKHRYIFYSNVFNMFSDEEIYELKNHWILEKEYRCLQVKVQLYRNPGDGERMGDDSSLLRLRRTSHDE